MVFPFVIFGIIGPLGRSSVIGVGMVCGAAASSTIFRAHLTTCLSREGCVGVCGEPCGMKVGDTASSSIQVARSTLCLMERDEVDWIVDRSSGLSPTKPRCWSVIITIGTNRFGGQVQSMSICRNHFRSV